VGATPWRFKSSHPHPETCRAFSRLARHLRGGSGLSHLYPGFSYVNRSAAPWSRGTSGSPMRDTFLSRSRSGSRSGSIYAARSEPPGRDMYIYAWRGAERRSGGGDSTVAARLLGFVPAGGRSRARRPGGSERGRLAQVVGRAALGARADANASILRAAGESAGLTPNRRPALCAVPAPCRLSVVPAAERSKTLSTATRPSAASSRSRPPSAPSARRGRSRSTPAPSAPRAGTARSRGSRAGR
jgi:hypothetical protein